MNSEMNEQRRNDNGGCSRLDQEQLEAVDGGFVSSGLAGAVFGDKNRAVHSICGTELTFRQIVGTYYCPACKKEVPFNEIIKGSSLVDSAGSRGILS